MPNLQPTKTKVSEQKGEVRRHNFDEVCLGYTPEEAINEAQRCLNCKDPRCVKACPVNVKIPQFIARIAAGDVNGAYEIISETNALPAVCGRVCPQETQCEGSCVRSIKGESVAIGRLERFTADHAEKAAETPGALPKNAKRVAIVGADANPTPMRLLPRLFAAQIRQYSNLASVRPEAVIAALEDLLP